MKVRNQKRLRDYGISIGNIKTGIRNSITDIPGVKVGHVTLNDNDIKTGVTVIIPHKGNIFKEKLFAASHVINGFGKTVGTIQINELGTLETPIALTNTLAVGTVMDALVDYMLELNEDIGDETGTVNAVVCECNDGEFLNNIRRKHVKKEHLYEAIKRVDEDFEEGGVGAGTGMSCYKLKGGIGSASRVISVDDIEYTIGTLVLANHGEKQDLTVAGLNIGEKICQIDNCNKLEGDKGSIITVLATDLPLCSRQLARMARRAVIGIGRTGSHMGHGSGEIVIAFSTSNRIKHYSDEKVINIKMIDPDIMDTITFRATVEATEEAVLNAMVTAKTTTGKKGNIRRSLAEYLEMPKIKQLFDK
jgi:D-aminopeptidase